MANNKKKTVTLVAKIVANTILAVTNKQKSMKNEGVF